MTFINEYTSQDDINRFKLDELLNKYLNFTTTYKHHWIVDKDTESWLLSVKQINRSESLWILHYKNTNIEVELFKTKQGTYDLISIAPNKFNNVEIISTLREALKVFGPNDVIHSIPKETNSKREKKTQTNTKQVSKRKLTYLNVLTAIIVSAILFFIANESSNGIGSSVKNDDNNKTSTKAKTTTPIYDIYTVVQTSNDDNAIYGIDNNKLDAWTEIISFNTSLSTSKVDKYGNIYWRDVSRKNIYKANPDGTNMRKIATAYNGLGGIAIDNKNERIYWIQRQTDKKYSEIVYTDFSGINKHIVVSNKDISTTTRGIFYDYVYDKLYFSDCADKGIMAIDLKTKEIKKLAHSFSSEDIVLDYKNKRVIWTNSKAGNISSSNFDGSDKTVLIQFDHESSYPSGLTIDTFNERLIYGYYDSANNKDVLETSNLDGSKRKIEKKSLFKPHKSLFFVDNSNKT